MVPTVQRPTALLVRALPLLCAAPAVALQAVPPPVRVPAEAEGADEAEPAALEGLALSARLVYVGRVDGAPYDHFGWTLTVADDVDGDGARDFLVGIRPWVPGLNSGIGRMALISGRSRARLWEVAGRGLPDGVDESEVFGTTDTFGGTASVVGDVDGDGGSELLVLGGDFMFGTSYVRLLALKDGAVRATWLNGAEERTFGAPIALGDLDGDGRSEFGFTNGELSRRSTGTTVVAGLERRHVRTIPGALVQRTGDVDGDGVLDWLARADTFVVVSGAVVAGTAEAGAPAILVELPKPYPTSERYTPAGDHDGDGCVDVVRVGYLEGRHANRRPASEPAFQLEVASGRDGRTLHSARIELSPPGCLGFVGTAGDLDGDGKDELAIVRCSGGARLDLLSGAEEWRAIATAESGCWSFGGALVNLGDVDGDGHPELAVGDLEWTAAGPCAGAVHVLSWRPD